MRQPKTRNAGRRIRVGPNTHLTAKYAGSEGVLVGKDSNPAWPFLIRLDSGEEFSLEEWEFEFTGPASETLQPVQPINKPERVKSEVEKTEMAKATTKTRERVALKPTKGKAAPAPARGKATEKKAARSAARSTTNEAPARAPRKMDPAGWGNTLLKLMGGKGKRITLAEFYAKHEKSLAKAHPENNNIRSTIRQQLQSLARQGMTKLVRPGVWECTANPVKA